jgi:hypothetical protein
MEKLAQLPSVTSRFFRCSVISGLVKIMTKPYHLWPESLQEKEILYIVSLNCIGNKMPEKRPSLRLFSLKTT